MKRFLARDAAGAAGDRFQPPGGGDAAEEVDGTTSGPVRLNSQIDQNSVFLRRDAGGLVTSTAFIVADCGSADNGDGKCNLPGASRVLLPTVLTDCTLLTPATGRSLS
jgi:hypothetical protein